MINNSEKAQHILQIYHLHGKTLTMSVIYF